MSILWYWAVVVCEWIGALYMLALAALFVFTAASVLAGSVLSQRRREKQLTREITRVVASLTEEEVAEWLR